MGKKTYIRLTFLKIMPSCFYIISSFIRPNFQENLMSFRISRIKEQSK